MVLSQYSKLVLLFSLASVAFPNAPAQIAAQPPGQLQHTAYGVALSDGVTDLRIEALRPDVLRVRVNRIGHPAEDASWAVLPEARQARVSVTPEARGLSTAAPRGTVAGEERVTIADLPGNVLQRDAAPVLWDGTGFRVSKAKSP